MNSEVLVALQAAREDRYAPSATPSTTPTKPAIVRVTCRPSSRLQAQGLCLPPGAASKETIDLGDSSSKSSKDSLTCPFVFKMGPSSKGTDLEEAPKLEKEPDSAPELEVVFPLEIKLPKQLLPDNYLVEEKAL